MTERDGKLLRDQSEILNRGKFLQIALFCSLFLSSVAILGIWSIFYRAEMFGGYNFYITPDFGMIFELFILPALAGMNVILLAWLLLKR